MARPFVSQETNRRDELNPHANADVPAPVVPPPPLLAETLDEPAATPGPAFDLRLYLILLAAALLGTLAILPIPIPYSRRWTRRSRRS